MQLQPGSYMVIDLETVSKAQAKALPASFRLKDWGPQTLTRNRCYTSISDMHQIGVLIQQLLRAMPSEPSADARAFKDLLINKKLSANNVLRHAWLS